MKSMPILFILLALSVLPSCDGTSPQKLIIELPEPKAAAQAALQAIQIHSLIPQTSDATCADLDKNFYTTDDSKYQQESVDIMKAPFTGKLANLKPSWSGTQSRLIYVECFDANGGLILNGCAEVDKSKSEIELSLSIVCAPNMADCDNDFTTGCETDITTVSNCGACGQGCTNDHGQTACSKGACAPACAKGFSDCDGNPDNGCETDLSLSSTCSGYGTCSFVNNAPVCSCRLPYAGDHCEQCAADYRDHGTYPNCFQPLGDSCVGSECFPVPPTGQTACYSNEAIVDCSTLDSPPNCINYFCGQDAQYAQSRTFTCSGGPCGTIDSYDPEVITDSATGLMWQRAAFWDPTTQYHAATLCNGTLYGGYDGWRLPNPIELHSIFDHGQDQPRMMIDKKAFPGTFVNFYYWTSSIDINNYYYAWAVRFYEDGTPPLPDLVTSVDEGDTYYFRCVRGGPAPDSPGDEGVLRFVSYAGITEDLVTKLIWTSDQVSGCSDSGSPSCATWQEALKQCEGLVQGDVTDWRLPNVSELMSILDYGTSDPATHLSGVTNNYYWSSTSGTNYGDSAWIVDFQFGRVILSTKTSTQHFLCVH